MEFILNVFTNDSNQWANIVLLMLAFFRLYLEIIKFDFLQLPLSQSFFKDKDAVLKFHRTGLFLSVGYIIFSGPLTLFS